MDYKKAKSNKQAAMAAHNNAQDSFETAKDDLHDAQADADIAYENLTQNMAEAEAGDATASDVKAAKQAHKDGNQAVEDARVTVDAKAKSIQVFEGKKDAAVKAYKRVAFDHFKQQAEPIAQRMIEALEELQAININVQAFREDIKNSGLSPDQYIPTAFEKIELPVKHLRRGVSLEKWKQEMNQKSENLK
jgi:hypothetical protein